MQRRIILKASEDTARNTVAIEDNNTLIGYAGEHQATIIGFDLPESWLAETNALYQIYFLTSNGLKFCSDALDIAEFAPPSGVMVEGNLYVQLVQISSSGDTIKKTEVCKCTVGKSIADGEVIASYDNVKIVSQLTEELQAVIDNANSKALELAKAVANAEATKTSLKNITALNKVALFDTNGVPVYVQDAAPSFGGGGSVARFMQAKTAFIPSAVTTVSSGTFVGTNVTDVYINNVQSGITTTGAFDDGVAVHYNDSTEYAAWSALDNTENALLSIDTALQNAKKQAVTGYTTMITTDAAATDVFGNDYDNLPENSVVCIGYISTTAQNAPFSGFLGNVISTSYKAGAINGKTQIAISSTNRLLHRIKWGVSGVWTNWIEDTSKANVYYVGGNSKNQSLTQLFIDLANDTSEKIIYINPGTYDIYQEYRDAQIPTPPDDVTSSDYLTRCVFVPPNTKLIGIGNVTLEWNPSKDEITYGESRTWSPLNVRYACHIENISIHCKYGRYCIHDDSHNAANDQGVTHTYKNVKCVYKYSEDGYGFNSALGFGFSQKNNYVFEDCRFEIITNGNNSAFYGHSASGTALNADESPSVIVKNCIIAGGSNNNRVVRLQSLNKSPLKIKTLFEGCYIDGGVYLTLYYDDAIQAFDVTLKDSGNPKQTVDNSGTNIYPIKIYEPIAVSELKVANTANTSDIAALKSNYDSNVFAQKNLLPNARTLDGAITAEPTSEECFDGIGNVNVAKAKIKSDSTKSYEGALKFYRKITPLPGATYTLSFYAKGTNVNVVFYDGLYNAKTALTSQGKRITSADGSVHFDLTSEWQRYYVVYTLKNTEESVSDSKKSVTFNVIKSAMTDAEAYIAAPQLVLGADVQTDIEKLQQRDIERDIKKYSVSFTGSLSAGTRLNDAVGMRAEVQIGTDASGVVNDFDNVSFFNRPICCCTWDSANRKWRVNAYEGEPGFARDGSNGEVMYECTPFWYKADFSGEGAPHYVSVTGTPCEGYTLAPMFKNGYDKVYCSSYWMSVVDGKPTSRSGVYGTYGSLNSLMANARILDEKAHLETIEMLFSDYLLMLVEFATKDFQTVMLGASEMRLDSNDIITSISYSDKLDTSNITLNGINKSMYTTGQTICVGSTENAENHVINCKVLDVNGGESVCVLTIDTTDSKIVVGDYVSSRPWMNGATDAIAASSGTIANDGKHPCIWRGKVDPWADVYSVICNLLTNQYGEGTEDSPYSYKLQYLPEPWKYADGAITSDYIEANFDLATDNGYVKTLSADSRYPYLIGVTSVGASSNNYAAAFYYAPNGNIRTVRSGGVFLGKRFCSPVCFYCNYPPTTIVWPLRARLFCSP